LYRKNAKEELLQKCVSIEEGEKILKEIHASTCGNHAVSRTLVGKAFQASFLALQPSLMQKHLFTGVKVASFSLNRSMSRLRPYK
jgi:hypothetical protein